ncbi:hypothetical protein GZL_06466 [Streptomyces sp. 769]|nr:hypothetical protein GZL_06466 [Streptomyces sp. 769]
MVAVRCCGAAVARSGASGGRGPRPGRPASGRDTCSGVSRRALRCPPREPPGTPAPTPCPPGDRLNTRGQGQLRSTSRTGPEAVGPACHCVSLSDTGARGHRRV